MDEQYEIVNNKEKLRFETKVGEEFAIIEYRWYKDDIVLMHTAVPEAGQGKGLASKLAKFAMNYVKDNGLKMKVYCPYLTTYLEKHPEYNEFLTTNTHNPSSS